MEESLLSLLKREDEALLKMQLAGQSVTYYRAKQMKAEYDDHKEYYGGVCERKIEERDKALAELNEVRGDIKKYFRLWIMGD